MDSKQNKVDHLKNAMSHCSICEYQSPKTFLYVCGSEHVMCENCQVKRSRDGCEVDTKHSQKKIRIKHGSKKTKNKVDVLCSGDCKYIEQAVATQMRNNFTENRIEETKLPAELNKTKDIKKKDAAELNVQFMNNNYNDISSSVDLTNLRLNQDSPMVDKMATNSPRPIACPVCSIMIAINSFMKHFYFDHSKVPRFLLATVAPQHILSKVADFSSSPKCLAILLLDENQRESVLLMGAKVSSTIDTTLQIRQKNAKENEIAKENEKDSNIVQCFEENDNLLIWISKITKHEVIYDVQVTREDKKLSFSFTGEAMHVRDKQDALSVHQNAACLTIRGKAANRLIDGNNKIHVFVRLII